MQYKHFFFRLTLFFALLLAPAFVFAYEPSESVPGTGNTDKTVGEAHTQEIGKHEEGGFSAGTTITEHISDSHEWHLWGHTHIPLPVIVYTANGIECFSSNRFHENEEGTYQGKNLYRLNEENNKIEIIDANGNVDEAAMKGFYDISITKNVLTILLVFVLMIWIFMSVARAYTRRPGQAPRGLQSFMEPLIIFVRDDIAKASIGEKKYEKYLPYLLTIFFFIWISNLLGLIPIFPGGANMTGNIAVTMTLALFTFVITTVSGNAHYWRHVFAMPGVPIGILVILTPIEILGVFLRPFVLMIRLFANITAGHIIALSFFCMIFIFSKSADGVEHAGLGWGVGAFATLFVVFMSLLELLVAFLQAYVFTLLSAMYFGSATEEHHHADDHAHDHAPASAH